MSDSFYNYNRERPPVRGGPIQSTGFGSGWGLRLGMIICLGLLGLYGVLWGNAVQQSGGPEAYVRQTDFRSALTAATIISEGRGDHLYDLITQQDAETEVVRGFPVSGLRPYTQPPYWGLALAPLLQLGLPAQTVFTLWTLLSAAAAGLSLGILAAGWPARRGPSWLLMLAATSFFPLITGLMVGQSVGLALLGLATASTAFKYQRDLLAGACLALALVQPTLLPLILLSLIVARRGRALLGFGLAGSAAVVLPMPVLGAAWPVRYLTFATDPAHWIIGRGPINEAPQSWRDLLTGAFGAGGTTTARLVIALLSAAVLIWLWARPAGQGWAPASPAWDRAWALTLLLALPNDPALNVSGLTLALVPGWILATQAANSPGMSWHTRLWTVLLIAGYATTTPLVTLFAGVSPYLPLLALTLAALVLLAERALLGDSLALASGDEEAPSPGP